MTDEKIHENRLRRKAKRQDYELVKSRRRDPDAKDYGAYWLAPNDERHRPSMWEGPYFDLDAVEFALTRGERGGG